MAIASQVRVRIVPTNAVAALVEALPPMLEMPFFSQLQDNWCWAACCQMLLGFFQRPNVEQCQMASERFGEVCCADPLPDGCNTGCFPDTYYDKKGIRVGALRQWTGQQVLDDELAAGRPVELYYVWAQDAGAHVALVRGRRQDGKYEVHDPYYGAGPRTLAEILSAYGLGRWYGSYVGIALTGGH